MNVDAILRFKGRHVSTISPDAPMSHAIAELAAKAIGALVVSEDGVNVLGILSERDIVHGLADSGASLLDMRVADCMTRRVLTCTPQDTVEDMMGRMTERRIRHFPVVEGDRLCGIVSIGDLVKSRLDEVEYEASSLRSFIAGG